MTIFYGARDHDTEDEPSFFSLYGPLLLIALAAGLIAGTMLAMGM